MFNIIDTERGEKADLIPLTMASRYRSAFQNRVQRTYVKAHLLAQLRISIHLTIMLLPLTLGLTYVMLRPLTHPLAWIPWLVVGGSIAWLVVNWLLNWFLQQRQTDQALASLIGAPPPGYTGWGSNPARVMARERICFSNQDFQRAFNLLNPDLTGCATDDTACHHH
jgi:hypothetical protein